MFAQAALMQLKCALTPSTLKSTFVRVVRIAFGETSAKVLYAVAPLRTRVVDTLMMQVW